MPAFLSRKSWKRNQVDRKFATGRSHVPLNFCTNGNTLLEINTTIEKEKEVSKDSRVRGKEFPRRTFLNDTTLSSGTGAFGCDNTITAIKEVDTVPTQPNTPVSEDGGRSFPPFHQKRVSFNEVHRTRLVPSLRNLLSDDQKQDLWYTKEELQLQKEQADLTDLLEEYEDIEEAEAVKPWWAWFLPCLC